MRIVSVNTGLPRDVLWRGETVRTGIFKEPVEGPVRVGATQLEGDGQADLSVHGGPDKAVYAYPSEHYPFWRDQYPDLELRWGAFGENLTTRGLAETELGVGDRLRIGSAELRITQPRMPCFKLGMRLGRPDAVKRFAASGRPGFYLGVEREGELRAGDPIELLERDPDGLSVAAVAALYSAKRPDRSQLERAAGHRGLPAEWREHFARRLERQARRPGR